VLWLRLPVCRSKCIWPAHVARLRAPHKSAVLQSLKSFKASQRYSTCNPLPVCDAHRKANVASQGLGISGARLTQSSPEINLQGPSDHRVGIPQACRIEPLLSQTTADPKHAFQNGHARFSARGLLGMICPFRWQFLPSGFVVRLCDRYYAV